MNTLAVVWRPDFRTEKPEASLDQPVIQMREDDVVAVFSGIWIKGDGTLFVSMGMFKTYSAFLPTWISKIRNTIGARNAFQHCRYQLWLAREVKSNVHHSFDIFRGKVEIAPRFVKLVR